MGRATGTVVTRPLRLSTPSLARLVWGLVVVAVSLGLVRELAVALVGVDGPLGQLRPLNVDAEASIPTWIATALLFAGAAAWGLVALVRRPEPVARVASVVALVLLLASIDEGSSLHETLIEPLRDGLGLEGALRFGWVLVGAPAAVVLVLGVVRVRDRLPRDVAIRLLLGTGTIAIGAVGMELVGGVVHDTYGVGTIQWGTSTLVEETLELVGTALVVTAGLDLLGQVVPRFDVEIVGHVPRPD